MKKIPTAANVLTFACAGNPEWWAFVCRITTLAHGATVRNGGEVRLFLDGSALVVRSAWYDEAGNVKGVRCEAIADLAAVAA